MKIFTSIKPGEGRVREIQARALANWRDNIKPCRNGERVEIVDVGEDRRFDKCIAQLEDREIGAWINADILFESLPSTFSALLHGNKFLLIGQRIDLLPGGQRELHRPSGMDYFFFTKGTFEGLPPVIMGRAYCDSALVAHCLRNKVPVIDATKVITALHQWHDYGHVEGGREAVWQGDEARQNRELNHLRDFGPNIADATFELEPLRVVRRRVSLLRRMGAWRMWNLLTRGGIGAWGIHEYMGKNGARFFSRVKMENCSPNSNARMKFKEIVEAPAGIYSGFDFPCMWRALREKTKNLPWTIFLWDPPSLSHRDRFPPLRWMIDAAFRWFVRRCDRLVLNIHPGLLEEIGFSRAEIEEWRERGKLECRMQDAFEGRELSAAPGEQGEAQYDFGVLSNWSKAKGGEFMAEVLRRMPRASCLWIGERGGATAIRGMTFTGFLSQQAAFDELRKCRVLVVPYLGVRALKWNYCLKLFEYLPLGRPILASDNPGNAAVAAKYPGRIALYRAGDVRDFIAKCGVAKLGVRRIHVVSDRNPGNGMFVVASMMSAREKDSKVVTCAELLAADSLAYAGCEEVVVHGCWLPSYWKACWRVLRWRKRRGDGRPALVRMTHGSLSPVYLERQGKWKKRMVGAIERWALRRCDRIVATCAAERGWIEGYLGGRGVPKIEITDIKRFFKLNAPMVRQGEGQRTEALHVLYLGRRHPLKGVEYLERAVKAINESAPGRVELRVVSDHHGEELERDWAWCEVLCLPTLSDNFGLVVAEALERGKRVITTDGAPAWEDFEPCRDVERVDFVYLRGFREGSDEARVELLKRALEGGK